MLRKIFEYVINQFLYLFNQFSWNIITCLLRRRYLSIYLSLPLNTHVCCQHHIPVGTRRTEWGKTSNRKIMDIYWTAILSPEAATEVFGKKRCSQKFYRKTSMLKSLSGLQLYEKETATQKNSYFEEHLRMAVSTKLHFKHYSRVVIISFSTALYKSTSE